LATNKNDALFSRLVDLFQNGVGVARKTKGALDHKPGYNPRYMGIAGSSGVGHFKNHSLKKNTRNTFNHVMNPHAAHRQSRYHEYEQMEETAEIHTALNVMASEVTATDEKGKCFHIQTDNERIKELLSNLFYDVLNIEFNLYWYVRSLCKFGDFTLYNRIDPKRGIVGVTPIPINEIDREEDFNLDEPQMVQFHWAAKGGEALHAFQVTHMRLNGNESFQPFGTSILEGARKTWRQLCHKKGTLVLTTTGPKKIECVCVGDVVLSHDPDTKKTIRAKVKHVLPMGKQKLVRVKTLHRQIDVTPNHGLLVKTPKGELHYKKASEIICTTNYGVNKHRNAECLVLPAFNGGIKRHSVVLENLNFHTSSDFMKLFGFMHGNGWVNNSHCGFALGVNDNQNQLYIDIFENLFKKKMRISPKRCLKGDQASIDSKEASLIFKAFGFQSGFANKRVPSWVYEMDRNLIIDFLQGFHGANGCEKDEKFSFSSQKFLEDVQALCHISGVTCGSEINLDRNRNTEFSSYFNKKVTTQNSFRLYVDLTNISNEPVQYEPVISITEIEPDETYDLEVDHELHNFVANGIVTHNTLAEDAMLVYRVVRSAERRVFYVDTANVPAADVGPFLEQMRNALRSSQVVDQTSGRVDLRYNPFSQEEDYFIPVRGSDSGTKIDTLSGGANTTATEDVEYIQKKLFSALQVPKAFLGFDDSLSSKATLAIEDVRFAKTVGNIQKVVLAELNKLAYIHLFIHGFDGEDLVNFDLQLSNPSTIAQQQKLELLRTRLEIVKNNYDPEMRMLSREYFQRNILQMSEGEIEEERTRIEYDKKFDARIDAIEQKAARSGPYSDGFDGKTYGYGEDGKKTDESDKAPEEKAPADPLSNIKKPSKEEDGEDGFIRPPQSPVKPEDRVAYNRNRRHTHGPMALAQPDFRSMLSVKNSSLKDIYDKDFLGIGNPFREGKEMDMENIFEPDGMPIKTVSSPTITKEIEIMLKTMDEHLNISRQWSSVSSNLLAEGNTKEEV